MCLLYSTHYYLSIQHIPSICICQTIGNKKKQQPKHIADAEIKLPTSEQAAPYAYCFAASDKQQTAAISTDGQTYGILDVLDFSSSGNLRVAYMSKGDGKKLFCSEVEALRKEGGLMTGKSKAQKQKHQSHSEPRPAIRRKQKTHKTSSSNVRVRLPVNRHRTCDDASNPSSSDTTSTSVTSTSQLPHSPAAKTLAAARSEGTSLDHPTFISLQQSLQQFNQRSETPSKCTAELAYPPQCAGRSFKRHEGRNHTSTDLRQLVPCLSIGQPGVMARVNGIYARGRHVEPQVPEEFPEEWRGYTVVQVYADRLPFNVTTFEIYQNFKRYGNIDQITILEKIRAGDLPRAEICFK